MKKLGLAAMMFMATTSTAMAADTNGAKSSKDDPNRMICRSEDIIGSRLAKQKRCLTAAQWAEERRLNRESVERTQNRWKSE